MGATEQLAKFLVGTEYQDFPEKTVAYTERLFLRGIGITLWGSTLPSGLVASKLTRQMSCTPEAGVVGGGFKTTVDNAAFVNGASIHAAEWEGPAHPDEVTPLTIFPVALALGEKLGLSGKKIVEACILGFEAQARVSLACPTAQTRGFFPLPTFGILGAAATAARLLDLDVEQTRVALGVAASAANGSLRNATSMAHYFESAIGCRSGVMAALLAKEGISADLNAFDDGRFPGFCSAIAGKENYDESKIVDDLGKSFRIDACQMKNYPCCMRMQRTLEGLLQLIHDHDISNEDVESVEIDVNPAMPLQLDRPDPPDFETARFSIQHGVAAALMEKHVGRDTFTDEKAVNPQFREAGKKVKLIVHPEWGYGFLTGVHIVTVKLKDGRQHQIKCERSTGHPDSPFTPKEVIARYRECVAGLISPKQVDRTIELALDLRNLRDISELMQILTFPQT